MPNVDLGKYLQYKSISQENALQGKELASNGGSRSNTINIPLLLAHYHACVNAYIFTKIHTDFTTTLRIERVDCSHRCPEERSERSVKDAKVTGRREARLQCDATVYIYSQVG